MRTYKTISLESTTDIDIFDITSECNSFVNQSKIKNGALIVYINGSTASVSTIEYEPGLVKDIKNCLKRLFPPTDHYYHHETWNDGNGYSHIMATIMKPSITIPIIEGNLALGTWQQIITLDFDNKPRSRDVILKLLSD
jgi:secondary thiamine-phosphate synthase enzyme